MIHNWASASAGASFAVVPLVVQHSMQHRGGLRREVVLRQCTPGEDTCVPMSKDEIVCAIKKGKSNTPKEDGVTYDIINGLASMKEGLF